MAHSNETVSKLIDLIDDSIVATPMPQACSTVDKRMKFRTSLSVQEPLITEENAIQQGIAAIEEMKKKLNILNYMPSDSSIGGISTLKGFPAMGLDDQSLKKDTLMEESGFTNLQNISDLERDELYCRDSWGYIPSDKINMSLTAVENSKIVPPDFMPAEDSLFTDLQSYKYKNETKIIKKTQLNKDIKEESAEDISIIKYDDREIPSIADIALALKSCKEDANPRKIMDQVLKAGEKKTSVTNVPKNEKKQISVKGPVGQNSIAMSVIGEKKTFVTNVNKNDKKQMSVKGPLGRNSNAVNVIDWKPLTIEESLTWGSVEIGQGKERILHIIHERKEEDVYEFSLEGNNAFHILANSPSESNPCRYALSCIKHDSSYELHILFRPTVIGQAKGFLKIESKSLKSVKKVYLNGFGGKGKLLLRNIIYDLSSHKEYLILSKGLKKTFELENSGSSTTFFYFSQEVLGDYYDIQPKLGLIKANEVIPVTLSLSSSKYFISNIISLQAEKYLDVGKFTIHFGDESTRLRICSVFNKYKEESSIKPIDIFCPFLTSSNFPSSEVDVSLLKDEKSCVTVLMDDGISKTEIGVKAERSDLLESLDFDSSYLKLLSNNQVLVVKKAEND